MTRRNNGSEGDNSECCTCVACLCLHTAWPRGEESRFTASFYATLDAINDLSACRLVLFSAAADANNMNNAFFLYLSDIFASIPEN